jgi:hypothetical protein
MVKKGFVGWVRLCESFLTSNGLEVFVHVHFQRGSVPMVEGKEKQGAREKSVLSRQAALAEPAGSTALQTWYNNCDACLSGRLIMVKSPSRVAYMNQ